MGSPRARLDPAKTEPSKALDHFVITACILGVFILIVIRHRHFDPVDGMMFDPAFDVIAIAIQHPRRQSGILLEDLAPARTSWPGHDASILPWR